MSIAFSGLVASPSLETVAREQCLTLEPICPELRSCHVVIEQVHRPRSASRPFLVRIDIAWTRHELTLSRIHDLDPLPALLEAFAAARRCLAEAGPRKDIRRAAQLGTAI
jgi:hypothetical protein